MENKKIIIGIVIGIMLVVVFTSSASAKNYGLLDYMFEKKVSFTEVIDKTMSELLEGARFYILIHEDGSVERVALQEESVKESFDTNEMSKRNKILKGFGAFLGRGYAFGLNRIGFDEDSVGTATVLVNSTSVNINFSDEYEVVPIVTLTPLEFIEGQYKVSNKTVSGFNIVLQETQDIDVGFDWHAFAREVEMMNVSNVTECNIIINGTNQTECNITSPTNLTEGNFSTNETLENETIIDINETVVEENNETSNDTTIEIPKVNETVDNETVAKVNVTEEENSTIVEENITEDNETGKKEKSEKKDKNSTGEEIIEPNEEPVEKIIEKEHGEEPSEETTFNSLITGGVIGTNNQDGILTKLVRFIGGLFN